MSSINVSVITTVYNEASSITQLLSGLKQQTLLPDEVVVVDAGSNDSTVIQIHQWRKKNPQLSVKVITKPGVNRSVGRNIAISHAKNLLICVTDAGCIPNRDWLQLLTGPLQDKRAESVAGYYRVSISNSLEEAMAPFLAVDTDQFNSESYLPSSRSVAFTKKAWQKAGTYPEQLNYCEDLVFAQRLKKYTKMVVVKEAQVVWSIPRTIPEFFKAICNYASGDLEADYSPHVKKIRLVLLRYLIFTCVPPLFFFYLVWPIIKMQKKVFSFKGLLVTPLIQVISDLAILKALLDYYLLKKATTANERI